MEIKLVQLKLPEGKQVFDVHMARDFPADEIKPWAIMEKLYLDGCYDMLAAVADGEMVGYAWQFRPGSDVLLIDYLAVLPQYRGRGIGSGMLRALSEYYPQKLILESEYPLEAPDRKMAERRLGFYARAGFELSDVQVRLFGVRFHILAHGGDPKAKDHMQSIYQAMLPPELTKTAVEFL